MHKVQQLVEQRLIPIFKKCYGKKSLGIEDDVKIVLKSIEGKLNSHPSLTNSPEMIDCPTVHALIISSSTETGYEDAAYEYARSHKPRDCPMHIPYTRNHICSFTEKTQTAS